MWMAVVYGVSGAFYAVLGLFGIMNERHASRDRDATDPRR